MEGRRAHGGQRVGTLLTIQLMVEDVKNVLLSRSQPVLIANVEPAKTDFGSPIAKTARPLACWRG